MKNTSRKTIAVLIVLAIALLVPATIAEDVTCQQSDGMWGAADPNIFYICDATTNTPQQMRCAEGRGFFNGLGYYGCLPFDEWPACINHERDSGSTQYCDAEHLMQPWETSDPNKFYMCLDEAAAPLLVNCEAGRGFVNATTPGGGNSSGSRIVGCAKWEQWRDYMQCRKFY